MMATTVLSNLRNLTYTGDTKNYNFDKYVTNHVQQHNLAHSLVKYGAAPIAENYKIDYFLMGIKCADFDAAKASLNAGSDRFTDFDSVKDHSSNFDVCNRPEHLRDLP